MKPFDLQAALDGAPVVTRDGRPVKIAGYNPDAAEGQKIAAWLEGFIIDYSEYGKRWNKEADLFMAPTERKEWVVRVDFKDPEMNTTTGPFMMKENALRNMENWVKAGFKATIHEITVIE